MAGEAGADIRGRVASRIMELEEAYRVAKELHTYLMAVLKSRGEVQQPGTVDEFTILENSTAFPGWIISLEDVDPILEESKSQEYKGERWTVFQEISGGRETITNPVCLRFEPTEDHPLFADLADGGALDSWAFGEECAVIDGRKISTEEMIALHAELAELFPI